jgi:membrane protein DedA with SNARE-associated domain
MVESLDYFFTLVDQYGSLSYFAVFLLCFIETLAFVGTLLPGGFLVIAVGFFTIYTQLNIWYLIIVATLGAFLGDLFSYYLGTKGTHWFKHENKLLKLSHLEKAQIFFKKHGNKSVFLGRFIGIIKPIIPFVAGLSKMDIKKFIFWNLLSCILWSASHLYIGYYLGGSFQDIGKSKKMEAFLVIIPIIIVIVWIITEYRERILRLLRGF